MSLTWFEKFLSIGLEAGATDWIMPLGEVMKLRVGGETLDNPSYVFDDVFDKAMMAEWAGAYLSGRHLAYFQHLPEDDFISGDYLVDSESGRFVVCYHRRGGKLTVKVRKPKSKASPFFDLLSYSVEHGASDIHVRQDMYAWMRCDGHLQETQFMTDRTFLEEGVTAIVPQGGSMAAFESNGDWDFSWEEEGIGRFRVNLHRQRGKWGLAFRHVKSQIPSIKGAGLPEILKKIADKRNGIILVAGTTGCGKSTTLGAMLDHINNTRVEHVVTIEDPIEYAFQDNMSIFEQREIGLDTDSFQSALIHALRQDPDVIMIGEMRDKTTFDTALMAADTGHLVLSTVHAKDASQVVTRLLEMYPNEEREQVRKSLSQNLQAVICQRLAPKAGGKGVVPVVEILVNTPVVRKFLQENKLEKLSQAIAGGKDDGMSSFNNSLLELYNAKKITEETALQYSDSPQQLKMNLQGIFLNDGGIIQ